MKLVSGIYRRYNIRLLIILTIQTLFLSIILMGIIGPAIAIITGSPTLDVRLGYTVDDVRTFFAALADSGTPYYQYQLVVDSLYPASYAFLFAFAMIALQKRLLQPESSLHLLVLLPFVSAIFDYCENLLLASQALSFPNIDSLIVEVASVVTILKFALVFVVFGIIMIEVVALFVKKFRTAA